MRCRLLAGVLLLCTVVACGLAVVGTAADPDAANATNGMDASTYRDAPTLDAGSDTRTSDAVADVDGSTIGPCSTSMVFVDASARYCIDEVEVTELAYAALITADAAVQMPATCAFKAGAWRAGTTRGAQRPVADIDWCDAFRYCAWRGKRLCTQEEWQRGCNDGTGTAYPYGNIYDASMCVGGPRAVLEPANVGSFKDCHGPLPIFDMSGNVDEWIACGGTLGAADPCTTHGGDYGDVPTAMRCDAVAVRTRAFSSIVVGMRCCSESL